MSHGGSTANASYILRSGECESYYSNMGSLPIEIIGKVKELSEIEVLGNRELGIRANPFARNLTKLIISLPNDNTNKHNMQQLKTLLDKTNVSGYPHIIAIHRGEKDGIENRHAHIGFFERKFEKGNSKKNRDFNGRRFLTDFKKQYQEQFGFTINTEQRERIPFPKYDEIKNLQQELKNINDDINRELVTELGSYATEDIGPAQRAGENRAGQGEHGATGQGAIGDSRSGTGLSEAIRVEQERERAAGAEQERLRAVAEAAARVRPKQKDNTLGRDKDRGRQHGL